MVMISVIVPVFNAEKTLDRLLLALREQTFKNYEILLCDDGSEDSSLRICREYTQSDSRIRVLALPHAGVSAARNAGITSAKGRYIAFADSDDEPLSGWLAALFEQMNPDCLSVCGYNCVDEAGNVAYGTACFFQASIPKTHITPAQFVEDIFTNRYIYQGYVWNKLFERSLVEEHEIRFDPEIDFNEDRLFVLRYLLECKEVIYSGTPKYNYLLRDNTAQQYDHKELSEMHAFLIMINEMERRGLADAAYYAVKDSIRAAKLLYSRAFRAGNKDAEEIEGYLLCYGGRPDAF